MKVKLEKAASAIALAAIMGSTLAPAYALEMITLPAIPSIIQQQQSGTRIDIVDNELVADAAYNILNIHNYSKLIGGGV